MSEIPTQYVDRATAQKELESYVFGGRYGRKRVPTELNPADVEGFIRHRLDRAKSVDAFARSRRVVDYYDLTSVLDHYDKMVNRNERDSKEFGQSLQCIMVLADVGDAVQNRRADEYFRYLVLLPLAPENYVELVEALEGLGPDANAKLLADRMRASLKGLQHRTATNPEADDEYQRIDQLLNDDMPRIIADSQLRSRIQMISDPAARIEQLCRIYMGWGENDTTELTWWSARWIRRESRGGRTTLVVTTLRKVVSEIEASDLANEEKAPYKIRAARATRFLGGELTVEERRVLERASSAQMDVLDRER